MTLADVAPTGRCRIIGAAIDHRDFQSRLYALGLYPGVWVDVLLSIRKREASLVMVELES